MVGLLSESIKKIYNYNQDTKCKNLRCKTKAILILNESQSFRDLNLKMVLTNFSHKRPYTGGSTKGSAYITIITETKTEEITLSVHGIEGKSGYIPIEGSDIYDLITFNSLEIHLTKFNYNESIEIIIYKNIDNNKTR